MVERLHAAFIAFLLNMCFLQFIRVSFFVFNSTDIEKALSNAWGKKTFYIILEMTV